MNMHIFHPATATGVYEFETGWIVLK